MWAPLLILRNTVAGAACVACGVRWLVALSACNLNPPQPVPASAASPRAILFPEASAICPTKNGKNRKKKVLILRPSAENKKRQCVWPGDTKLDRMSGAWAGSAPAPAPAHHPGVVPDYKPPAPSPAAALLYVICSSSVRCYILHTGDSI